MANNTRAIDAPRENRVAGTGEPVVLQDAIGNAMRAYWDCLDRKRHSDVADAARCTQSSLATSQSFRDQLYRIYFVRH